MKVGVPYLGVLVIRSLLFRLLYWVPPFSGFFVQGEFFNRRPCELSGHPDQRPLDSFACFLTLKSFLFLRAQGTLRALSWESFGSFS